MKRTDLELTSTNATLSRDQAFQRSLVLSQTGFVLLSEGKFLQAVKDLNESLSLNPSNVFALTNRAQALMPLGKTTEALFDLDTALDLNPDNAFALTLRGNVLLLLNHPLHALDDLDAALRINPENAYALICRDIALRQLKQFKQAVEDIDQVLKKAMPAPSTPVRVSDSQMGFFKGKAPNASTPLQESNENLQKPFRVK